MCVDNYAGFIVDIAAYHICGLSSDPGQLCQFIYIAGNFILIFIVEYPATCDDVFGLIMIEAG